MDWSWVTGRVVTATGWTFETLNQQSSCDVLALLDYWHDEPPAHVVLALRYLGPSKRRKPQVDEEQARWDMAAIAGMTGRGTITLPEHLKQLIRDAEVIKQTRKGI